MNQRPLGPEDVCVRLSNGFRRFSALSARTEIVSDGHDFMDSGYSGQKYGQVCGQTTYFPIGLMRNRGRKVIVLQHGSANIARGLADISADTNGQIYWLVRRSRHRIYSAVSNDIHGGSYFSRSANANSPRWTLATLLYSLYLLSLKIIGISISAIKQKFHDCLFGSSFTDVCDIFGEFHYSSSR